MELRRINITAQEWQKLIDRVTKLSESNRKDFEDSRNNTYIRTDGLAQVPITNKEWASMVHYEHDEQTLWFRPHIGRTPSGFLVKKPFGPFTALALARSVTWNAALYIHFMQKPIAPKAISNAIGISMRDSSCPSEMMETAIQALVELCYSTLDALSAKDGTINRCSLQMLKNELSGKLGRRTCSNRPLRKRVAMRLLAEGIATMKTRREQQVLLIETFKSIPELRGTAIRSIERTLQTNKTILNATGGVCVLLPYTDDELSSIRSSSSTQGEHHSIEQRAEDIKAKMLNKEPLTHAERTFKYRNKDLFK